MIVGVCLCCVSVHYLYDDGDLYYFTACDAYLFRNLGALSAES